MGIRLAENDLTLESISEIFGVHLHEYLATLKRRVMEEANMVNGPLPALAQAHPWPEHLSLDCYDYLRIGMYIVCIS